MVREKIKMLVKGQVQGVGFRYTTFACAKKLHIAGQVWNNPDGSVTIQAQSEDSQALANFQNQVRLGFSKSPWIKVESVDTQADNDADDFSDFQVVYRAG